MQSWSHLPSSYHRLVAQRAGSVLLHTSRFGPDDTRSYLFSEPVVVLSPRELGELPALFREIELALKSGYYVAGFLSYECGYHFEPSSRLATPHGLSTHQLPLAWFGVFQEPLVFNHRDSSLAGTPPRGPEVQSDGKASPRCTFVDPQLRLSECEYAAKLQNIKRLIEAGDTYQVNFTSRMEFPVDGDAAELSIALIRSQPVSYGAFLNLGETQILSASPELFFRAANRVITTRPMKGTAPRGKDIQEDAVIARWLEQDEKNRSENVMIVDLLRNDLGRICKLGTVRTSDLFSVEKYRSLFQMTSTVQGELRPEVNYYDIFRSLFPCGSIVGAPKIRTMQIIRELEAGPRGVYTGSIGFISPHGEAVFNVAIRTLVLQGGKAEMGVGSGIVYDSDPSSEYEECRLKTRFLTHTTDEFQLIETMLWDKEYLLLSLHLDRLAASAAYFDFSFSRSDTEQLLLAEANSLQSGSKYKTRLLLNASGEVKLTSELLPPANPKVSLRVASERTCSGDVFLRHKTTRRSLYDRQYAEAVALGFTDAVFCNERGEVTEGAIHNIFVQKQGQWLTPPLSAGVLPGVYRQHLLQTQTGIQESPITLDDLLSADAVFLCNSVRGWRRAANLAFQQ